MNRGTGVLALVTIASCASPPPSHHTVATVPIERRDAEALPPAAAAAAPAPVVVVRDEPTSVQGGPQLPGPCVSPRPHAAGAAGSSEDYREHTEGAIDLDGDGVTDFLLTGIAEGASKTFLLYLRRGTCGYDVGSIDAQWPEALGTRSNGLVDLAGIVRGCTSFPGTTSCRVTYAFDGRRYRATKKEPYAEPKHHTTHLPFDPSKGCDPRYAFDCDGGA